MKILMCEPRFYDVCYRINPWMHRLQGVEVELARQQWQFLNELILRAGAEVVLIDQVHGLPDMVFTANAGLVYRNKVFLSHFRFPERQGESEYFKTWFERRGYEIAGERAEDFFLRETEEGPVRQYRGPEFEGAGDALFAGETLFGGFGFRSDKAYFSRIGDTGVEHIVHCELIDPYFYHLDTCFCPLNEHQALWWPRAFSEDSQERMSEALELLLVPEPEALRFACNAVVLEDHVIMPEGCPTTRKMLESAGYTVYACDMSEFIKSGGACKCLTLML
jgi:N-dimethylarginine dimethylaminohydrolase